MLLRTAVSCKYVDLFVNELNVDLSNPSYLFDSTVHDCQPLLFSGFYLIFSLCFVLCRVSAWFNE